MIGASGGLSRPSEQTAYSHVSNAEPQATMSRKPIVKSGWMATSLIVLSFLFGVAVAVGHDRYNHFLDGRRPDEYYVSQEWVSRIETGFAFLVKTFLSASVTTAYTQQLWQNIKNRALAVSTIDILLAAPTDLISQISPLGWLKSPGMLLLGAVVWLIPFAAVVTPGTLTVIAQPASNITNLHVPHLSFDPTTWASLGPESSSYQFWSASPDVQRTGFSAATSGKVTGASHLFDNQSYSLNFWAPAVQCSTANDTVRNTSESFFLGLTGSGGHIAYFSWVEGDGHGIQSGNGSLFASSKAWSSLDTSSTDAARIYVYSTLGADGSSANLANVTVCLLHNASYTAVFSTVNGVSTATANITLGAPLPALGQVSSLDDATTTKDFNVYAYQSPMDVFGRILVGYSFAQNAGTEFFSTSYQLTLVDFRDLGQTQKDLETLFQNITLSMFSNNNLLLNATQAAMVPVAVTSYPLTYQYLPRDLWISYGSALFVTLIAALAGLRAAWSSGVSYSSKFSTAARVAKHMRLYEFLPENDDGSDPLPEQIGAVRIGGPGVATAV